MLLRRVERRPQPPSNLNERGAFGHWLVWMLAPRGRHKAVAVLESYCDESGIHDGANICAVSGWVASSRNWCLFEDRWAKASRGIDFHSKEFFARDSARRRVGPYRDFTDGEAAEYLAALVDVIRRADIKAVGAVVDTVAFHKLPLDDRKWLTGATWHRHKRRFTSTGSPNRPYYLGFISSLETSAEAVKKPGLTVDFCFDQQNVLAPWALLFFQRVKSKGPAHLAPRLGTAVFKSKVGVGALQAADMLSASLYKHFSKANIPDEFRPVTETLEPLIKNQIVRYFESDLLRRAREFNEMRRKAS